MSSSAKAQRLRDRLPTIDPDAPAPPAAAAAVRAVPATAQPSGSAGPATSGTGSAAAPSAVDEVVAGKKDYRSFYIDDAVYARFRAAVHWTGRRQDAVGKAPESMSAAVEEFMEELATRLEREFNGGEVFPPAPRKRKS